MLLAFRLVVRVRRKVMKKAHHGVIHNLLLNQKVLQVPGVRFADIFMIRILVHAWFSFGGYGHREQALRFSHVAKLFHERVV